MVLISNVENFEYKQTTWTNSRDDILAVRHKVFMIEQRFDGNVLCDILDPKCFHVVVSGKDGTTIAAGRLSPEGRIGRIAVQLSYRNKGIGSKLLSELIDIGLKNNLQIISLNAEIGNSRFYNEQNFSASGPVYMKNGVPYQMLTRKLA